MKSFVHQGYICYYIMNVLKTSFLHYGWKYVFCFLWMAKRCLLYVMNVLKTSREHLVFTSLCIEPSIRYEAFCATRNSISFVLIYHLLLVSYFVFHCTRSVGITLPSSPINDIYKNLVDSTYLLVHIFFYWKFSELSYDSL